MRTDSSVVDMPKLSILIVDDIDLNLKVLSGLLRKLGLESDLASCGEQALSKVKEKCYDFIFMDIQMPGMDGNETTRQIRSFERKFGYPQIVAVTAHGSAQDKERCLASGMNGYLEKPVLLEQLCLVLGVHPRPAAPSPLDKVPSPHRAPHLTINWSRLDELAGQLGQRTLSLIVRAVVMDFPARHVDLGRALRVKNAQEALRVSHQQRGALGNLGITSWVLVLQQIEDAVRELRWEDATRCFEELQGNYDTIAKQLTDYIKRIEGDLA